MAAHATLWVRGLQDEGPGDLVGAFTGEADVDGDRIGRIELTEEGDALVDVDAEVADQIIAVMDGNQVGRSTVSVSRLDADMRAVREYVRDLSRLVELEREEEMRRHEHEIRALSGSEREKKGRALLQMRGRSEGESFAGHLLKVLRESKGEPLPDTEIGPGDLVMLSKTDPLRDDNPTGTVTQVTGYSLTVAFDREPFGWMTRDGLRVDLYVNDVTYQRMHDALSQLPDAEGALARLRDVCVGTARSTGTAPETIDTWHDPALNDAQKQAVRESRATDDVHLIHGPPGTGKTTTALEVLRQCVGQDERVLATAASNTAVDNLVAVLAAANVDVVRVGHPARVHPTLEAHTLDARLDENETYRASQEVREDAFDLLDAREDLTVPRGRYRRGLSDEQIQEMADEGKGARGVSPEVIAEMAEWLRLRKQADRLFEKADRLEDEAVGEILEAADVVCTTNATAGSDLLDGHTFDTLVIDEATQATAPSCWIAMVHARRVILAGDHRQLPPTVLSAEAAQSGMRTTLFERLARHHPTGADDPSSIRSLLRVQYRMHEQIMDFSSTTFYNDRLQAHESVRGHTLADLGVRAEALPAGDCAILDPAHPLVFVDTRALDAPERQRPGSSSRENPGEAKIVARLTRGLLAAGLDASSVAVITPYADQVRRLTNRLEEAVNRGVEVDSVDGFQGREKDAVLVSLVRSNPDGELGFLDEPRRFNVSLTRARRKAVVVGDASTITTGTVFERFVDYAQKRGRVVRPEEA